MASLPGDRPQVKATIGKTADPCGPGPYRTTSGPQSGPHSGQAFVQVRALGPHRSAVKTNVTLPSAPRRVTPKR